VNHRTAFVDNCDVTHLRHHPISQIPQHGSSSAQYLFAKHVARPPDQASDDEVDFLTLATASRQASRRTRAACKQLATHLLSVRLYTVGLWTWSQICSL